MTKNIQRSIAKRILEVESDIMDSLSLTKASSEYMDLLERILEKVDDDTKDLIRKLDNSVDPVLFYTIRKAYFAGLQDGMKVGESI